MVLAMEVDNDLDLMINTATSTLHELVRTVKQLLQAHQRQAQAAQEGQPLEQIASEIATLQQQYVTLSGQLRESIKSCCALSEAKKQQAASAAAQQGGLHDMARHAIHQHVGLRTPVNTMLLV